MRWTLMLLLTALYLIGCTGSVTRPGTEQRPTPPTPGPTTPSASQAVNDVYVDVPRHPEAESHEVDATTQRAYMRVVGTTATDLLSWYASSLSAMGWEAAPTGLPADRVLRLAKDGRYLSLSAFDVPERFSVIWFHLRSSPEVTVDEALDIAGRSHRSAFPLQWVANYMPEFDSDRYGNATKQPIWVVEGRYESILRVVVYVDAITAEPFRIKEIETR